MVGDSDEESNDFGWLSSCWRLVVVIVVKPELCHVLLLVSGPGMNYIIYATNLLKLRQANISGV